MKLNIRALTLSYLPVLIARIGSGANTFLISYLAPGSNIAVGFILASYPFVEAASSFVAGHITDRVGRRVTMILGYSWILTFTALVYLTIVITGSPTLTGVINGLMGFGAALILVSSLTMITDLTELGHRGLGMGVFDFINILGYALGYMTGAVLYQITGNASSFIALLALMVTLYAVVVKYIIETKPRVSGKVYLNPLKGVSRRVIPTLPLWFSITTILGAAIYAGRAMGRVEGVLPIHVGALILGAVTIVGLGSVFFGHLSDRFGRWRLITIGLLGVVMGLVTLATLLIININPIITVLAASPFIFMASALVPTILALTGDESLVTMRGTSMGLYSLVLGVGMGLGNILSGYFYTKMGLGGIAVLALVVFLTALVLYAVLRAVIK
ncbi:MFS transporter [Vulcanisaeta thermophila]|uniref:MFS transporter n=1 Tax=Vulcanisaeta thermophila TaxID=867917 RepID=UPI000853CF8D|nr:MFS transporter [Vulcanisaeta thermophila]